MSHEGYDGEAFDEESAPEPRVPRDPADTLRLALIVYIVVNLALGIPLAIVPVGFLDFIGVDPDIAADLGGLRWVGAVLVAWGISAVLVLARPVGRAYFVTVGALQMTLAAVAFFYSWWRNESLGSAWFQVAAGVVLVAAAIYLWWARLKARSVLAFDEAA
jgi:hypothetical protein